MLRERGIDRARERDKSDREREGGRKWTEKKRKKRVKEEEWVREKEQ